MTKQANYEKLVQLDQVIEMVIREALASTLPEVAMQSLSTALKQEKARPNISLLSFV